jgi:hypothetical protein
MKHARDCHGPSLRVLRSGRHLASAACTVLPPPKVAPLPRRGPCSKRHARPMNLCSLTGRNGVHGPYFTGLEPLPGPCGRVLLSGGLRYPDVSQRHRALFSLVALCVWTNCPTRNGRVFIRGRGVATDSGPSCQRRYSARRVGRRRVSFLPALLRSKHPSRLCPCEWIGRVRPM